MFSAEVSYLDVLLGPQQALPGEARVLITAGVKGGRHHLGLITNSNSRNTPKRWSTIFISVIVRSFFVNFQYHPYEVFY